MVLALGSGFAQVIALAFSPIITRLYSPSDFAVITMFLTITGMLLPFICGKYEVAIVVAGTDRHASELTALSCCAPDMRSMRNGGVDFPTFSELDLHTNHGNT